MASTSKGRRGVYGLSNNELRKWLCRLRKKRVIVHTKRSWKLGVCWKLLNSKQRRYQLRIGRKRLYAYQVIQAIKDGREIPEGMVVHHSCGEPQCFRPSHLTVMSRSAHSRLHGFESAEKRRQRAAAYAAYGWLDRGTMPSQPAMS